MHLGDTEADLVHQFLFHRPVDKEVIGRNARLAGVDGLPPCDTPCGNLNVRASIDDAGAFSSQFQNDRRQMFGSGPHHDLAETRTSGKENDVEALLHQQLVDLSAALNNADVFFIKGVFDSGTGVQME